jgi:hypothetical protein
MRRKLVSLGLIVALMSLFSVVPTVTAQKVKSGSPETTFPVSFVGTSAAGAVNFVGTLNIQKFDVQNNKVAAI